MLGMRRKVGKLKKPSKKQLAARRKFTKMVKSKSKKSSKKTIKRKRSSTTGMRKTRKTSRKSMSSKMSFNGILKNGLNVFKDKRVQGVAKGAGVAAVLGPALDRGAPQISGTISQPGQRIALGVLGGGLEGGIGGIIAYAAESGRLGITGGSTRSRGSRI